MTKPLFDVFRETMMDLPDASRKEAQDAFVERMKADPAYLEILARDYFDRMAAVWTVKEAEPAKVAFGRTEVSQDKVDRMSRPRSRPVPLELVRRNREEAAARTAKIYEEMKAGLRDFVLMNMVLPDGTALRDAKGADCVKAGGFISAIGKAIKPTQVVGRQLTESDLQSIKARYYQKNAGAA